MDDTSEAEGKIKTKVRSRSESRSQKVNIKEPSIHRKSGYSRFLLTELLRIYSFFFVKQQVACLYTLEGHIYSMVFIRTSPINAERHFFRPILV
jgi:hypothetical protein